MQPQTPEEILAKIDGIENISDIDELNAMIGEICEEESYYKVAKRIRELMVLEEIEEIEEEYEYEEALFKKGGEIKEEKEDGLGCCSVR